MHPVPRKSPVTPSPPTFDDAFRLDAADFRRTRLVAFCGVSGAGKTTAIRRLCQTHRDFRDRDALVASPAEACAAPGRGRLFVIEEVRQRRDLGAIWTLLRRDATLLVASHLAPPWFAPFRLAAPIRTYALDDDWRKIARYLDRRQIPHSDDAVRAYCRRYGANYFDAELIIERYPDASFDLALAQFERRCRIHLAPARSP